MAFSAKFLAQRMTESFKALRRAWFAINALEPAIALLSDEALSGRILALKEQLSKEALELEATNPEAKRDAYNRILDPYLHEVFAIVREAGKRVLSMRHFDVQLLGAWVYTLARFLKCVRVKARR